MSGVNKVILLGRLGKDPEARYTSNGNAMCNVTIATSDRYKDKSGQTQEKTEWHKVVFWGKQAELATQYLSKGSQVYVEGSLQTRKYEDKQGQTKYVTEIKGREMTFVGSKGGNNQATSEDQGSFTDEDVPF